MLSAFLLLGTALGTTTVLLLTLRVNEVLNLSTMDRVNTSLCLVVQ